MTRRQFLRTTTFSAAALALPDFARAIEPFLRPGKPALRSSLAAYSFRDTFKSDPQKIDLFKFIDYCADQGLDGAELTSYYFPAEITDNFLLKVKRHAFLRGVAISGTAIGNNFALPKGPARDEQIALCKTWIDRAALMGAPHIRVFAGVPPKGMTAEEAFPLCIEALEECCAYAGIKGIFLGVENHGGIVAEADDLLRIVKAVKSPWLGINLDSGNFHTADPYGDLAKIAPYAVNAQVKVEMKPKGAAAAEPVDLPRLIKILRDANYQGYVALEYEAKPDPWTDVPVWLGRMKEALR